MKKVGNVQNFNWAWQYRASDAEEWQQFECTDCLQLEFNYQAFIISEQEAFKYVKLIFGTVNMLNMVLSDDLTKTLWQVRRAPNNERSRPNAERRHDPCNTDGLSIGEGQFISDTPLEWASLNYRKVKAAKIDPSRRRIILKMF